MRGRVCMVTGATSGIGRITALELAAKGATVVLVGRNEAKLTACLADINRLTGNDKLDYIKADLSSFQSVRGLARTFLSRYNKLHVLVNNAGAIFLRRDHSNEGLEMTWALNHFGYFWLTGMLLDCLKASAPSRIINVSSDAHKRSHLSDFPDVRNPGKGFQVYADTKLANILFTYQLAYINKSTGVTVNACHPGIVATAFGANNGLVGKMIQVFSRVFGVTAEQGARTLIYLATAPEVYKLTGKYFVKEKEVQSAKSTYDARLMTRLWQFSLDISQRLGMDTRPLER